MFIAQSVIKAAVPHKISVSRDEHGIYEIWHRDLPDLVKYPMIRESHTGAVAAIRLIKRRLKKMA